MERTDPNAVFVGSAYILEFFKEVEATEKAAADSFVTPYADRASLDLFWQVGKNSPLEQLGERTAAAFRAGGFRDG